MNLNLINTEPFLFSYRPYWAARFGIAPQLPMFKHEMEQLNWDSCDIILITGDAYVDHPSFGMALIGRLLEAQGFRVGIIAQPDWTSINDFQRLGAPNLFFGITSGNMDSMVNRYTADRRLRSDDAYTPDAIPNRRPDRSVIVYAQRTREAFPKIPIIIGGIEASLRRIAHFDYWSSQVRRSILIDTRADLLLFGNAERAIVTLAHRLARGELINSIRDLRGSAYLIKNNPLNWSEIDATQLLNNNLPLIKFNPYEPMMSCQRESTESQYSPTANNNNLFYEKQSQVVIRLPSFEQVRTDPLLYAHAARIFHQETNPHNARALVQAHGNQNVWLNPPQLPLTSAELDRIYELPYSRRPHDHYGQVKLPAWEMIRCSVSILRGCFGGCTFCSITGHEGRIIQNRSVPSILRELEEIRDRTQGFTGIISDLGGPTANMWRMACRDPQIAAVCRRFSCLAPKICVNLNTDHGPLINLYQQARRVPGIKKILIASGLRFDLAVRSPEYIRELATYHVGGYLKIAPEHSETGPLNKMNKPEITAYDQFKQLFEQYSRAAGKEQYLIPYFIAGHPGTTDQDMLNLALWLKQHELRLDQVQNFLPTPLTLATAMYYTGYNPLQKITPDSESITIVRGDRQRRLHKAFLRYHDPENWPLLRQALHNLGREDLIGNSKHHLIPRNQPIGTKFQYESRRRPHN